jgi:amino acid transporter
VISFLLAGITCVFSALAYAELASSIPVSGSAYTYAYATMGELLAWIIGWDLILEYGVSVAAVAVGWGAYLTELLDSLFGITLSESIALPPGEGGDVNLPAAFLVLAVGAVLIAGVRHSARSNTVMVITKIAVLLFFIVVAFSAFDGGNFSDFAPNGFGGIEIAAALIFFAYIGFDAVSTASEESKRPERDLPIAIVGSLVIATVIYILVAIAAVGALPADQLAGQDAPLAIAELVNIGTLFAFLIVNIAVIWLRRTKPDMERGFRVPFVPVLPLVGAALCIYLMTKLPVETWLRFGTWLLLGLVIYGVYGYRNSRLPRGGLAFGACLPRPSRSRPRITTRPASPSGSWWRGRRRSPAPACASGGSAPRATSGSTPSAGSSVTSPAGTRTCTAASWSRRTTRAPTSASSSGTRTATRPRAGTARSRSGPGLWRRAAWRPRKTAKPMSCSMCPPGA